MPAQNKDEGGWQKFIWDSEKKEFLGRTGGSWCKYKFSYNMYTSAVVFVLSRYTEGALVCGPIG